MERSTKQQKAVRVLGGAYFLFLLYLFLVWGRSQTFPDMPMADYVKQFANLVPFKTTAEQLRLLHADQINRSIVLSNTLGHLLAFLPLGMLMTAGWKWKWPVHLAFVAGLSLLIELLQLFLRIGSFDVDALLFNVLGYFTGLWAIYALAKHTKTT